MSRTPKIDLEPIAHELARIATALEALSMTSNPIPENWQPLDEKEFPRVTYESEEEQIIREHVERLGKEYKPRRQA